MLESLLMFMIGLVGLIISRTRLKSLISLAVLVQSPLPLLIVMKLSGYCVVLFVIDSAVISTYMILRYLRE